MQRCYDQECDDTSHIRENNLEFLQRSINATIKTVLDLSEVGKLYLIYSIGSTKNILRYLGRGFGMIFMYGKKSRFMI